MSTSCLHPPSKQRVYSFRGTDKHRLHVCGQGVQLGAGAAVPAAAVLPAGLGAAVHEAGGGAAGLQRVERLRCHRVYEAKGVCPRELGRVHGCLSL